MTAEFHRGDLNTQGFPDWFGAAFGALDYLLAREAEREATPPAPSTTDDERLVEVCEVRRPHGPHKRMVARRLHTCPGVPTPPPAPEQDDTAVEALARDDRRAYARADAECRDLARTIRDHIMGTPNLAGYLASHLIGEYRRAIERRAALNRGVVPGYGRTGAGTDEVTVKRAWVPDDGHLISQSPVAGCGCSWCRAARGPDAS